MGKDRGGTGFRNGGHTPALWRWGGGERGGDILKGTTREKPTNGKLTMKMNKEKEKEGDCHK